MLRIASEIRDSQVLSPGAEAEAETEAETEADAVVAEVAVAELKIPGAQVPELVTAEACEGTVVETATYDGDNEVVEEEYAIDEDEDDDDDDVNAVAATGEQEDSSSGMLYPRRLLPLSAAALL